MGLLGTMTVNFGANLSGLQTGVSKAQANINGFASTVGVGLLAVGAAMVAGGIAATKMAGDFQAGITSLSTGAGEAQSNLKMVSDGILGLAVSTGTSTQQLTAGMYQIESAGYHGAAGLDVLKNAAEGAKVGNADLGVVANGVTTIMTDFASQNINASQATNTLVATVASGKTTMQQLSASLSSVLPTASAAHVGLTDVMSAMATMTGEGVPAANAATYLRQTIQTLSAPSKSVTDALKGIGISAAQASDGIKTSLPNTLHMITEALGKKFPEGSVQYNQALTQIAGGSKQLQGILDLTGSHANAFAQNFDTVDNAVTGTSGTINGFSQVQQTFNFKMAQAQEVLETTGIKIGTALLPSVGKLLDTVTPLITKFGDWVVNSGAATNAATGLANVIGGLATGISNVVSFFQKNHVALVALQGVLMVVAGIIGGILVQAFVAWAVSTWAVLIPTLALLAPYILVGAIVGAVIFGIILAIQHWGQITAWFQGVWGAVSSWFMGVVHAVGAFFVGVWSGIASFFIGVWNGIVAGLQAAWAFIINVVKIGILVVLAILFAPILVIAGLFIWLYQHNTYFKMLVDAIVDFFKGCITWLVQAWTDVSGWIVAKWNELVHFANDLWNSISKAIHDGFAVAIGFVASVWDAISSFFSNAWNTYIVKPLTAVWTAVSTFFSGIWTNYIAGPIGNLWNQISGAIGDWVNKAVDWGKNLIQGFVNGIIAKAGSVADAVGGIAGKVLAFLGFHSPTKEGPGSEADQWAPNFVKMYASGLEAGIPKIQAAMQKLAAPAMLNLKVGSSSYPTSASNNSAAILAAVASSASSSSNNNQNAEFHIYLDSKEITAKVGSNMASAIRAKGVRSR